MNTLLVLVGPTGVGKTEVSLQLAERLKSPVVSSDSRQIYKQMAIGTAAPTDEQLRRITHYFVGMLDPENYYSASQFEEDAIPLIEALLETHSFVVMSGGSMLYIDAVCRGIDVIPTIDKMLRKEIHDLYQREGFDAIRSRLKMLDPVFYNQVDLKNPKRVIHALEVCLMAGKPYSSLRTNPRKERSFNIVKIGLTRNREELYLRINQRVDKMIEEGLIEEARNLYPKRHLNSLNTVGYKELFDYFDGNCTLDFAIEKIKQHSRNYARKQMTWFKRDEDIKWIDLSDNTLDAVEKSILLITQRGQTEKRAGR
jgi:tRNA dimethylallyltransferase